jgi:hypothetical protein
MLCPSSDCRFGPTAEVAVAGYRNNPDARREQLRDAESFWKAGFSESVDNNRISQVSSWQLG